jgi:Ornithine/acetylornithine aminotransferase
MIGVELSFPGQSVVDEMCERKILTNCTNNNVIRILPSLIVQKEHVDFYLKNFEEVISSINVR